MKLPQEFYPLTGTVILFKPEQGYGFIREIGGEEYFFHISQVTNPDALIKVGSRVGFMHTSASAKGLAARAITIL